jgi:hypothetical protein
MTRTSAMAARRVRRHKQKHRDEQLGPEEEALLDEDPP